MINEFIKWVTVEAKKKKIKSVNIEDYVIAREAWNHQQKEIDALRKQLEKADSLIQLIECSGKCKRCDKCDYLRTRGEKCLVGDVDIHGKDDWKEVVEEVDWFINNYSLPPKKRELIELGHYYDEAGNVCLLNKQDRHPNFERGRVSNTSCLSSLNRPVKGMKNIFIYADDFSIVEGE